LLIYFIGDAYMAVGGVPTRTSDHAQAVADMALEAMESLKEFNQSNSLFHQELKIRIGIHTGPCIAGVVGKVKYVYDLYGETVKIAAAMESRYNNCSY
jgi:class 3 adenylate cyclase